MRHKKHARLRWAHTSAANLFSLFSWWWLEPPPCLRSQRSGTSLFLPLARCAVYGKGGKKREVFRHAIRRERTYARMHNGSGKHDVEIKRTRKRTALVDGRGVVAFIPHPAIRIYWGINRNMHTPSISRAYRYHRPQVLGINVECM